VEAFDVAGDGRDGVEDGVVAQGRFVGADPLGVAVAEGVVGERAGSALGVVDHGDLEQGTVGQDVLGELADEGDIVDHLRGDPPADVADDQPDLGRLINFIKGDAVEADDVLAYVRRLKRSCAGEATVIDAPRADRNRVCLGIAERAGLCTLEPAPAGQLEVTFAASPRAEEVASICRVALDRAWRAYRAVESFSSASGDCRRRALLDHFGDSRQATHSGGAVTCAIPTRSVCPPRRR
jgi:hypothetical protein